MNDQEMDVQALGSSVRFGGPKAGLRGMEAEDLSLRYSLVCHQTRTKVVVGANGSCMAEMLSALGTDDAKEALCAFLIHNHAHPLFLVAENWVDESSFPLYREFSDGLYEGAFE